MQERRSWRCAIMGVIKIMPFRLFGWSEVLKETNAMKKLFTVLLVAGVMAGPAMAESLAGIITDDHCAKEKAKWDDKQCVRSCVKRGAAPVLVMDEGKVFKIANPDAVKDVLGEKVRIEGTVSGDTVTVDSVKADQ